MSPTFRPLKKLQLKSLSTLKYRLQEKSPRRKSQNLNALLVGTCHSTFSNEYNLSRHEKNLHNPKSATVLKAPSPKGKKPAAIQKRAPLRTSTRHSSQNTKKTKPVPLAEYFRHDEDMQQKMRDLQDDLRKKNEQKKMEQEAKQKERRETLRKRAEECNEYNLQKKLQQDELLRRNELALHKLVESRKRKR